MAAILMRVLICISVGFLLGTINMDLLHDAESHATRDVSKLSHLRDESLFLVDSFSFLSSWPAYVVPGFMICDLVLIMVTYFREKCVADFISIGLFSFSFNFDFVKKMKNVKKSGYNRIRF